MEELLSDSDHTVLGHLVQMFTFHSKSALIECILHPDNRQWPLDEYTLLQRCIDDILERRTVPAPNSPYQLNIVNENSNSSGRFSVEDLEVVLEEEVQGGVITKGAGSLSQPFELEEDNDVSKIAELTASWWDPVGGDPVGGDPVGGPEGPAAPPSSVTSVDEAIATRGPALHGETDPQHSAGSSPWKIDQGFERHMADTSGTGAAAFRNMEACLVDKVACVRDKGAPLLHEETCVKEKETPLGHKEACVEEVPLGDKEACVEAPRVDKEAPLLHKETCVKEKETPLGHTEACVEEVPLGDKEACVEAPRVDKEAPLLHKETCVKEKETPLGHTEACVEEVPLGDKEACVEAPLGDKEACVEEVPLGDKEACVEDMKAPFVREFGFGLPQNPSESIIPPATVSNSSPVEMCDVPKDTPAPSSQLPSTSAGALSMTNGGRGDLPEPLAAESSDAPWESDVTYLFRRTRDLSATLWDATILPDSDEDSGDNDELPDLIPPSEGSLSRNGTGLSGFDDSKASSEPLESGASVAANVLPIAPGKSYRRLHWENPKPLPPTDAVGVRTEDTNWLNDIPDPPPPRSPHRKLSTMGKSHSTPHLTHSLDSLDRTYSTTDQHERSHLRDMLKRHSTTGCSDYTYAFAATGLERQRHLSSPTAARVPVVEACSTPRRPPTPKAPRNRTHEGDVVSVTVSTDKSSVTSTLSVSEVKLRTQGSSSSVTVTVCSRLGATSGDSATDSDSGGRSATATPQSTNKRDGLAAYGAAPTKGRDHGVWPGKQATANHGTVCGRATQPVVKAANGNIGSQVKDVCLNIAVGAPNAGVKVNAGIAGSRAAATRGAASGGQHTAAVTSPSSHRRLSNGNIPRRDGSAAAFSAGVPRPPHSHSATAGPLPFQAAHKGLVLGLPPYIPPKGLATSSATRMPASATTVTQYGKTGATQQAKPQAPSSATSGKLLQAAKLVTSSATLERNIVTNVATSLATASGNVFWGNKVTYAPGGSLTRTHPTAQNTIPKGPGVTPTAPGATHGATPGATHGTAAGATCWVPGFTPTASGAANGAAPGATHGAAPGATHGAAPGATHGAAPGATHGAAPGATPGLPGVTPAASMATPPARSVAPDPPLTTAAPSEPRWIDLDPRDLGWDGDIPDYVLRALDDDVVPRKAPDPAAAMATPPKQQKSEEDVLTDLTKQVCGMFTDADPVFVRDTLRTTMHEDRVAVVCNYLLETPSYPRVKKSAGPGYVVQTAKDDKDGPLTLNTSPTQVFVSSKEYFHDFSSQVSAGYRQQCIELLQNEFLKVSVTDLRAMAQWFGWHFAPLWKCISEGVEINGLITYTHDHHKRTVSMLKCGRRQRRINITLDPALAHEVAYVMEKRKVRLEESDKKLAATINDTEYQQEGQTIECGCCYGDYSFESMVQCYEGHLFCRECLQRYAHEAVFGQGHAKLECLCDGCTATFPKSQLEKALDRKVLSKYEERQQAEAINLADLEDLVRCPQCEFAAVMDPGDKVFRCQNLACMKETCRYCQVEWTEHFGKPCKEMEKKDETKLRLKYEERMSELKIRKCHRCKASFTKSDGCNKMTCRCGARMCYICRKPDIDYSHFCNHPRDPGKKCVKCEACSLWTNPDEDEERALMEMKKEAQEERKNQGFTEDKAIGVPETAQPPRKKAKRHR